MAYTDINGGLLSPAQNPYAAKGSASSVAGYELFHPIVERGTVSDLLKTVRYSIKYKTEPIRFFFAGDYGSGKTTRLNLVRREVLQAERSLCIPIRFQEIANQISMSGDPNKSEITNFYGMVLDNIRRSLISQGALSREECLTLIKQADKPEFIDLIMRMFAATTKSHILLIFDEVEILFSSLKINVSQLMTFLHDLSEKCFSTNRSWGICVSVTGDYLINIQAEAAQLKDGRFDFRLVEPLSETEIKDYIEEKNSKITLRFKDKSYPFNQDIIDFVSIVSGGMPRNIEVLCHLIWASKADENSNGSVDINTARRLFVNQYRAQAFSYFEYVCKNLGLDRDVQGFLKVLFAEGGYRLSVNELISKRNNSFDNYLYNRTDSEARYILYNKASFKIRETPELSDIIEISGRRPFCFSLTKKTFNNIYTFESQTH
ncbi:hypothetical protein QUB19_02390 [Microcoleus sp. B4-C5]|uniref:hypothetical protein n=1 Tax=unclassified Microcoleus TaxID=2642155 RepID=UPI002FD0D0F8